MSSRYGQVIQTYLRRWWLWAMAVALVLFAWLVHHQEPYARRDNSGLLREMTFTCVLIYVIIASTFAGFVMAHLKEQMAQWRATLAPGYRMPHIVVAALALLAVAVLPEFWSRALELATVNWLPLVMVPVALTAWIVWRPTWTVFLLVAITGATQIVGQRFIIEMLAGSHPRAADSLLILATTALAALLWRACVLREEMPEYSLGGSPDVTLRPSPATEARLRQGRPNRIAAMDAILFEWRMPRTFPNIYGAARWRRARHWRHALGYTTAPFFIFVLLAAFWSCLPLMGNDTRSLANLIVILNVLIPILVVAMNLPKRWDSISAETLRPAPRRELFIELFLATASELAEMFAAVTLAGWVALSIWDRTQLMRMIVSFMYPAFAVMLLLMLAINIWVLRLRRMWLLFITMIAAYIGCLIWLERSIAIGHSDYIPGRSIVASIIALNLAMLVLWDAYRRWLRTDLD